MPALQFLFPFIRISALLSVRILCRAVTTAVVNRTADMSQSQPLNSATTGIPLEYLEDNPYICPRTDSVEKLATILDEKKGCTCQGNAVLW
jgi:hypothetical protein